MPAYWTQVAAGFFGAAIFPNTLLNQLFPTNICLYTGGTGFTCADGMGPTYAPDVVNAQLSFPGAGTYSGPTDCTGLWTNSFTFNFASGVGLPAYYGYGLFGGATPYATTYCFYAEAFATPYVVPTGGGSRTVTPNLEFSTCTPPYQPGFWAQEGVLADMSIGWDLGGVLTPTPMAAMYAMLFTSPAPLNVCTYTLAALAPDYVNAQATYAIDGSAWLITMTGTPNCAVLFQQFFTYTFPSSLAGTSYYGVVITPKNIPSGNYAIFYYSFGPTPYVVPPGGGSLTLNFQMLFAPNA
jgi:hypothetical protein